MQRLQIALYSAYLLFLGLILPAIVGMGAVTLGWNIALAQADQMYKIHLGGYIVLVVLAQLWFVLVSIVNKRQILTIRDDGDGGHSIAISVDFWFRQR